MHVTQLVANTALFLLSQAADPSASTPPPAAATMEPAPAPVAPAPDTSAADRPTNPRHWRTSRVEVPGTGGSKLEVRVLRADDTAVSLGEGLADVGDTKKLQDRAARLDDSQTGWQAILGRVVVLSVGGAFTLAGIIAAVVGAAFWGWSTAGLPSSLSPQVTSVVISGPSILLTGLIAAAIGLFTVVTTAALWAWFVMRGPPPADPAVVQALGASLSWEDKESAEVVARHNSKIDAEEAGAGATPPPAAQPVDPGAPAPAPAPVVEPAPPAPADPAPAQPTP